MAVMKKKMAFYLDCFVHAVTIEQGPKTRQTLTHMTKCVKSCGWAVGNIDRKMGAKYDQDVLYMKSAKIQ